MESEEELVAAGRGKWSVSGVPHKGWICVDVEDLGEPSIQCEMCESQDIRYVHHMQHAAFPEVGCICAGHMENSVGAARAREASMKSRAGKRSRWLTRTWKISQKGNFVVKAEGFRVTVYPRAGLWACTIAAVDNTTVQHSRRNFKTSSEAKLAAFDQITKLLSV